MSSSARSICARMIGIFATNQRISCGKQISIESSVVASPSLLHQASRLTCAHGFERFASVQQGSPDQYSEVGMSQVSGSGTPTAHCSVPFSGQMRTSRMVLLMASQYPAPLARRFLRVIIPFLSLLGRQARIRFLWNLSEKPITRPCGLSSTVGERV